MKDLDAGKLILGRNTTVASRTIMRMVVVQNLGLAVVGSEDGGRNLCCVANVTAVSKTS
jgi:hypothetical protein